MTPRFAIHPNPFRQGSWGLGAWLGFERLRRIVVSAGLPVAESADCGWLFGSSGGFDVTRGWGGFAGRQPAVFVGLASSGFGNQALNGLRQRHQSLRSDRAVLSPPCRKACGLRSSPIPKADGGR